MDRPIGQPTARPIRLEADLPESKSRAPDNRRAAWRSTDEWKQAEEERSLFVQLVKQAQKDTPEHVAALSDLRSHEEHMKTLKQKLRGFRDE
jgi:hypothetical protein